MLHSINFRKLLFWITSFLSSRCSYFCLCDLLFLLFLGIVLCVWRILSFLDLWRGDLLDYLHLQCGIVLLNQLRFLLWLHDMLLLHVFFSVSHLYLLRCLVWFCYHNKILWVLLLELLVIVVVVLWQVHLLLLLLVH